MWAKRDYLELAFYPTSTHLEGELFRHLRFFRHDSIPLERQSNPGSAPQYRLAHARQLSHLENILFSVRKVLSDKVNFLVGLEKISFSGPSSESYTSWYLDEAKARNRAFFARKKFLYHIATISFYIAIITYGSHDRNRWYSVLIESGVPGAIADKLSSTMVADFSPNVTRAGVFVCPDQETALWEYYIRVLISANVPVYVFWGPIHSSPLVLPCFNSLYPTQSLLEAAFPAPQDVHQEQMDPPYATTNSPRAFGVGSDSAFPPPEPLIYTPLEASNPDEASHPFQYFWKGRPLLPGEQPPTLPKFLPSDTPASFFSQRAAARDEYIMTAESSQQKAARLVREENARPFLITKDFQDEVYEWCFDHDMGRWKRILVPPREHRTIWGLYSSACKRYDPVAGEWDLAEFLDYDEAARFTAQEHGTLDSEGDQDRDSAALKGPSSHPFFREGDYHIVPSVPSLGRPEDYPTDTTALSRSATEQLTAPCPPSDVVQPLVDPPSPDCTATWEVSEREVPNMVPFVEALLTFHAFRWGSSEIEATRKRMSLQEACKTLGFYLPYHGTGFLEKEEGKARGLVAWVSHMLSKRNPPPDWWLLHPDSVYKLKRILKTKGYPLRLSVLCNKADSALWWCIHKQSHHRSQWFIVVEDATAASAAIQSR